MSHGGLLGGGVGRVNFNFNWKKDSPKKNVGCACCCWYSSISENIWNIEIGVNTKLVLGLPRAKQVGLKHAQRFNGFLEPFPYRK